MHPYIVGHRHQGGGHARDRNGQQGEVRCTKECFQDCAGIIASNTEVMTAGNILVGGVIGLGVDAASGAMNKYTPETSIVMLPIQGCRPPRA